MRRSVCVSIAVVALVAVVCIAGCPPQRTSPPPALRTPTGPTTAPRPAARQLAAQETNCTVCGRLCPSNRVIQAETSEGSVRFCCPVCLATHIQQGKIDPITDNITLHDYVTGQPLSLEELIVVVDSDVVCPAGRSAVALGGDGNTDKFIAEYGGAKMAWDDFFAEQIKASPKP